MITEMKPQPATKAGTQRQLLQWFVVLLVSLGGGTVIGLSISAFPALDAVMRQTPLWLYLSTLMGGLFLAVVLHEIGHLIGGLLVGFRFSLVAIGPFMVRRRGNAIRFEWNWQLRLRGAVAATYPPDTQNLNRRMAVAVAGGPVMNALLILLCVPLLLWLPSDAYPTLWLFLVMVVFSCVITLLSVTFVSRSMGFLCDRARLQVLLSQGQDGHRFGAALALTAASMSGVRPRDWDPLWIDQATALRDGEFDDLVAHLFAYAHWLDRSDPVRAGEALSYVLDHRANLPPMIQPGVNLEAAYFTAWEREDTATARQWLAEGSGGLVEAHNRLRAEAAVLLVEGQLAQARAKAEEALRLLPTAADAGSAQLDADLLQAILVRAAGK